MKADLIVIGIEEGAGNIKEHIIGSTAIEVARKQNVPTFIIPEKAKYHRIHKISFACDLKKIEETNLVYISKFFSKIFDAELEIVNVVDEHEEITEEKAATYLFMKDKLKTVKHKTLTITGHDVKVELTDYFKSHPTDIIMINPKKHNLFYFMLSHSITNKLAFHTTIPILSIH